MAFPGVRVFEKVPEQYIVWDGFELGWTKSDINKLNKMWEDDKPLEDIVNTLRPKENGDWEVFLAIAYQLCRGYIQPRAKSIIIGGI